MRLARGFAAGFSLGVALIAGPAGAHLMAAGRGTVNVVGPAAFVVLSVPVSALHGVDDDGDGALDVAELRHHEDAIRAEVDRRLAILDGDTPARTVRVDLILAPEHDAAADRAAHVVALKHAAFDAPPADLRVRCDLFGAREPDQALAITATRHPESGTDTEVAQLMPGATEHAFFQRPAGAARAAGEQGPATRGLLLAGAVFVVVAMARPRRTRSGVADAH